MLRTGGKTETAQAEDAWAVIADRPRQELQHSTELYYTIHPSFYLPREQFAQQTLDHLRVRPFRVGERLAKRTMQTRNVRWEQLDEELTYAASQLDRDVVSDSQIRTVIRTFRDKLFTEIFPGRAEVPKTLIFAKDDSHAEDIVRIVREEFGRGNDFCQKITYRVTGVKPDDLIAAFRNSFNPRIAVTVDMIAAGTDVKPIEIVMFMRAVKSRNYFEQMLGRATRRTL